MLFLFSFLVAIVFAALGANGALATGLPSTIASDTTLTPESSPYESTGNVVIAEGITLTVEPGVTVKTAGIRAEGNLKASGSEELRTVFTSPEDSGAGQWEGIKLETSDSVLDEVEVRDATTGIESVGAVAPTISRSIVRSSSENAIAVSESGATVVENDLSENHAGIAAIDGGAPQISGNIIDGCDPGQFGILYEASEGAEGEVKISDNTVRECGAAPSAEALPAAYAAISVTGEGAIFGATLGGNVIEGGGRPIDYFLPNGTIPPDITENALAENEVEGLWVGGFVVQSATWAASYPIVVHAEQSLRVIGSAHLSLAPGSALKAEPEARVLVWGELKAEGTETEPVVITGSRDDSIAGDTNSDGTNSTPAAGDWGSIQIEEQGRAELSHTIVRYGGNLGEISCEECNEASPMVTIFGEPFEAEPSVVDQSTFEHAAGPALAGVDASTVITDSEFRENPSGLFFVEGGSPEIADNTVEGCGSGGYGIYYKDGSDVTPSFARKTVEQKSIDNPFGRQGAINIHGNLVEGCGASASHHSLPDSTGAISVYVGNPDSLRGAYVAGETLSENIVRNGGRPIDFYSIGGGDIPADITENILSNNEANGIWLSGEVWESTTWRDHGVPIIFKEGLAYGTWVAASAQLTLEPGLVLKSEPRTDFAVFGKLVADGTSNEPVTFTSLRDDSVGGDTNGDGTETSPAPGDWNGIVVAPYGWEVQPGTAELNFIRARYGGAGDSCESCSDGAPMLTFEPERHEPFASSELADGAEGRSLVTGSIFESAATEAVRIGTDFEEANAPQIEWNEFGKNQIAINKEGGDGVKVPHNSYGSPSGPRPGGAGDLVEGEVDPHPIHIPEDPEGHCRGSRTQCLHKADPVNLATGTLSYAHVDLTLANRSSTPLEFVRTYSSGNREDGGLGPGWSLSGIMAVSEQRNGDVLVVWPDGREDRFIKTESGFEPPSGIHDSLSVEEGHFVLREPTQAYYEFDPRGRILVQVDDHGLEGTYVYNESGRLSEIEDSSGQWLRLSFDGQNHVSSVEDSTGREVVFGYTSTGRLKSVTDALGGLTEYDYDANGRLSTITDPRGNVILENTYDGQGRIVEQRDGLEDLWKLEYKEGETVVAEPEGGKLLYGYDAQDRGTSEEDQLGNVTTTSYDAAGNIDEVLQPGGAKWTFDHDVAGNLTSVEDPEGGVREYEYDAQNRPISFTDAGGDSWSYEWSEAGDLVKSVDPEGRETTATYNEAGQPLTRTDPNNHKSEFSWDTRGNQLTATDPLGHKTSFEYDSRSYLIAKTLPGLKVEKFERNALGDLLARTTPEGHKTKFAYDKNGLPIQITDPGENVWKIERNAMERPTAYIDPLEQQEEITYDGNLNPIKVVNRRGKETTYGYDLANHLTDVNAPEGGDWHYGYDSRGNRASLEDPLGHETSYKYDLLNRMVGVDQPLGVSADYGYDPNGALTSIVDPRGNTTEFTYDKLGRLTEVAQPLEKSTTYGYDPDGNRVAQTTAAGTLEFRYDAADRLTQVSAGESTLRSLGYDAANRLTSATDAEGHEIEIGRNEDGLVSSIDDGRGQSLTRSYNSRGLLSEQVDGRGTLEYGYDELARLTSLTDPQGKAFGFGYDPEGDLTEVTRPSGVTTENVFDEAGRLAETTSVTGEPPTTLESLEYGYDTAGEMTGRLDRRLEKETTYGYDALGRLTEFDPPGEGSTAYGYDKAGNRTEAGGTTYTYNALNQLTEASDGTTYNYDGAGRMTGRAKGSEETTYEWSPLDQLTGVEGPGGTASYAYDGLERLSERKGEAGTSIVHYGGPTDSPTYLANSAEETTTSYVQGALGLVEQRSSGSTSYPLADAHGDITAAAGPAGEVESRQSYGPWGEQLSGPGIEMGYLGAFERPTDPTSGLIQMGARSYDPTLGRFLSEDPVLGHMGVGISTNRYPYVWDDPLNRYDLNGRDIGDTLGDAAEGIGGAATGFANSVKHEIEKTWGESEEAASAAAGAASGYVTAQVNERVREVQIVGNAASDFWKNHRSTLESAYRFAGANREGCAAGAAPGALIGGTAGAAFFGIGAVPGSIGGGVVGCGIVVGASALFELGLRS